MKSRWTREGPCGRSPVWSIGLTLVVMLFGVAVWRLWVFSSGAGPARAATSGQKGSRAAVSRMAGDLVPGRWRVMGWVLYETEPERSVAFLSDASWRVTVPFERYCRRFVEGWVTYQYRG